jgi:hypothetical protein
MFPSKTAFFLFGDFLENGNAHHSITVESIDFNESSFRLDRGDLQSCVAFSGIRLLTPTLSSQMYNNFSADLQNSSTLVPISGTAEVVYDGKRNVFL